MRDNNADSTTENEYPKLVRDRIPEIIFKNEGVEIDQQTIDNDADFIRYLVAKISEEAREFQNASDTNSAEEELADIYEVLDACIHTLCLKKERILKIQREKALNRGTFAKRILMISKRI